MEKETQLMENRLLALVDLNKPENRNKWALQWKQQGKKIIGMLCTYVPEEIISACGMLPWRITGTWREAAPMAALYRPEMTCRYCSHVLESVLTGELDLLDGVITTNLDDDIKRLWDVLHFIQKPAFSHIIYLPHAYTKTTLRMWIKSVLELKEVVEGFSGVKISEKELFRQIEIYNTMRELLGRVYDLRKRETPPITGAEMLGITTAARIMPRDEFNKELKALIPYIENRKLALKKTKPRLLMSGEFLDNPAYVRLVEDSGSVVVMDDFDTGSKYFWGMVDRISENPWEALAARYINRGTTTARMINWNEQAEQIFKWIKEFRVDGVIELRQLFSLPLDYRFFVFKKKFADTDIPYASFSREYHLSQVGMLRTRAEAFIEMINARAKA